MFRNCSGKKKKNESKNKVLYRYNKINIYHAIGDIFSKFFFGG